MEWWTWLALGVFMALTLSASGLLFWRKLEERGYVADVADGNEEYLG